MKKQQGIRFFYQNRSSNLPDLPMDEFYDNFLDEKPKQQSNYHKQIYQSTDNTNYSLSSKVVSSKRTLFEDDQNEASDVPQRVMKIIPFQDNFQQNPFIKQKSQGCKSKKVLPKINKKCIQNQLNQGKKTITSASTLQDETGQSDNSFSSKIIIKNTDEKINTCSIFKKFGMNGVNEKLKSHKYDKYSNDQIQKLKTLPNQTPFNFSKRTKVNYAQTPHFKNKLQSPFWKFNNDHKQMIQMLKARALNQNYLQYNRTPKKDQTQFVGVDPYANPVDYFNDRTRYFLGIAIKFKQIGLLAQARIFFKLSCYVEPFNEKVWRKYIQFEEQNGELYTCFILSKTAYLFTLQEQFAKIYINSGQKCGVKISQICGLIACVNNPDFYEKTLLIQLAKIDLKMSSSKNKQKGLKILSQVCKWNDYKLPVCSIIIFLAKILQNQGYHEKALSLLKRSFNKSMSKLQIYTTYVQIKLRYDKGNTNQSLIKDILIGNAQFVSGENRYKLFLEFAQILYKKGDKNYKQYVIQAYDNAKKYCASGTGCNKTLRTIFFTVAKWKAINPFYKMREPIDSDQIVFQKNRFLFSQGKQMIFYNFGDWKYYLHFGLQKRVDLLLQGIKKWPLTGRLVAELIHCLRAQRHKSKRQILSIWRSKIQQVPKSGQLWCQGGRIYSQLQDYSNASKCFRSAIHFTPQYGDSFIEELKILLLGCRFHQIQRLKRVFFVSEPFYGHVWSYLRLNHEKKYRLSLNDMWQNAVKQISDQLYRKNIKNFNHINENNGILTPGKKKNVLENMKGEIILTAYQAYNNGFMNQNSVSVRNKLFASYQQMDNKN